MSDAAALARPARAAYAVPAVAWPTIALAALAVATWLTAVVLGARGTLSLPVAMIGSTLAAFVCFTPMHDAAHRSVSRRRWLGELVGRVSAVPLFSPFPAFRYVHLEHHKHTNEPAHDPDLWSGSGPRALLPLRWLTQDLHYYVVYAHIWSSRPRRERAEVVAWFVGCWGALAVACALGHAATALLLVALPARMAIAALAFSFDFLPHTPHQVPSSVDRYRATTVLPGAVFSPVLLYQNYHLVHHLYPAVPFYRYQRVYAGERDALLAKGAVERGPFARRRQ